MTFSWLIMKRIGCSSWRSTPFTRFIGTSTTIGAWSRHSLQDDPRPLSVHPLSQQLQLWALTRAWPQDLSRQPRQNRHPVILVITMDLLVITTVASPLDRPRLTLETATMQALETETSTTTTLITPTTAAALIHPQPTQTAGNRVGGGRLGGACGRSSTMRTSCSTSWRWFWISCCGRPGCSSWYRTFRLKSTREACLRWSA